MFSRTTTDGTPPRWLDGPSCCLQLWLIWTSCHHRAILYRVAAPPLGRQFMRSATPTSATSRTRAPWRGRGSTYRPAPIENYIRPVISDARGPNRKPTPARREAVDPTGARLLGYEKSVIIAARDLEKRAPAAHRHNDCIHAGESP
ncbi:hypothetical protein LY76DRAFT_26742 [Colletotrichum caudatum]|nr:hypothetical protein LY76DRAFT_26742 [Colletotrichum caudatum]